MVRGVISYEESVKRLNSLQSNASIIAQLLKDTKARDQMNAKSIPEMRDFLARMEITQEMLQRLRVIHVAGTKGKGSTCSYTERLLRKAGLKTGLFTSPHMVQVRERIRINGIPISESLFVRYLQETWDKLTQNHSTHGLENNPCAMPTYFRFLTLMAFHVFLQEKVDVAVIEVGIGGRFDATNVVDRPVVCGITSLGLDHVKLLGNSLDSIAKHKAGIMKSGVPCFTVNQEKVAQVELEKCASDVNAPLENAQVTIDSSVFGLTFDDKGMHQKSNAQLALALCKTFLSLFPEFTSNVNSNETLGKNASEILASTYWPGRNQIWQYKISGSSNTAIPFFLDGAHTEDSMKACIDWFNKVKPHNNQRTILLFNCTSDRSYPTLLEPLLKRDSFWDYVCFAPAVGTGLVDLYNSKETRVDDEGKSSLQQSMKLYWESKSNVPAKSFESLDQWQKWFLEKTLDDHTKPNAVLVTGSLHLVGAFMGIFNIPVHEK